MARHSEGDDDRAAQSPLLRKVGTHVQRQVHHLPMQMTNCSGEVTTNALHLPPSDSPREQSELGATLALSTEMPQDNP